MLWLELLYVRSYVQASKGARWPAEVPWTAFYSLSLVLMGTLAGLFKCFYNVLTAVPVLDVPMAVEQVHGRVIFIAALVSSITFTYMCFHVRQKQIRAKFSVTDDGFNFFDLISRFMIPVISFIIYVIGDSWLWLFFLTIILLLTGVYSGKLLRAGAGVELAEVARGKA